MTVSTTSRLAPQIPAERIASPGRVTSEQPPATGEPRDVLAANEDPTVDGRPLPPPGMQPPKQLPTPPFHKAVTAVCLGAGAWTLVNIGTQIAGLGPAGALLGTAAAAGVAGAAWVGADAASGAFHFLVDNYGSPKTPLVGTMIKEFQEHHIHPWDLNEVSVWSNIAPVGTFLGPALMGIAYANPHYLIQTAALSSFAAGYIAQASHRWAHQGNRAPAAAKLMQKLHVFQTKKQHDSHHAQPIGTYCIVNGACNPLLDRLNTWRNAEWAIYKATGAEPNTWFDPEVKKKALGTGNPADYVDPVKRREGRQAFWKSMFAKIDSWKEKPKTDAA